MPLHFDPRLPPDSAELQLDEVPTLDAIIAELKLGGPWSRDPKRLSLRNRISALPGDVPGADLCLLANPDRSAFHTNPTPGNRRAQPFKAAAVPAPIQAAGARPVRALPLRPLLLTAPGVRHWPASAEQADADQRAEVLSTAPYPTRRPRR